MHFRQVGTYRTSSTALQQVPRLTLAHWTCAPLQQLTSRRSSQSAVRMFPRDAEFATQQLQSIVAELRADPALSPILDDRKVAAAIKDIAANPTSLQKHANNPKVGANKSHASGDIVPGQLQQMMLAGEFRL